MRSRHFESNTEEERIEIFQEYFDRDVESFFTSSIACCNKCKGEFDTLWPGSVSRDNEFQYGHTTVEFFLENSRIQDAFYPEEIERLARSLTCPQCDETLDGEFWIYEHPFDVPKDFFKSLSEIADLASRTPFMLLTHPFACKIREVVADLSVSEGAQSIDKTLYRARGAKDLLMPTFFDFGPPPAHLVAEGRYNHAGLPMLYLATREETALAEVASQAVPFHVIGMKLNSPLKVLDLELKDDAADGHESLVQCLSRSALCSAPRSGEGWVKREYVFTRFLADCAIHAGFDAIRYGSTKDPNGANLVLLTPGNDVAAFATQVGMRTHP